MLELFLSFWLSSTPSLSLFFSTGEKRNFDRRGKDGRRDEKSAKSQFQRFKLKISNYTMFDDKSKVFRDECAFHVRVGWIL